MSELKNCSKCNLYKHSTEFNLHSKKKAILKPYCKKCQKIYDDWYQKTYSGLITQMYKSLKSSSKSRGHNPPNFEKEDFKKWLLENNYDIIYSEWELSGYNRWKKPSVDRLEDTKSYCFSNMRLVTWFENDKKHKDFVKYPIIIENVNTGEKVEYESINFAARTLQANSSSLKKCITSNKIYKDLYKVTKK